MPNVKGLHGGPIELSFPVMTNLNKLRLLRIGSNGLLRFVGNTKHVHRELKYVNGPVAGCFPDWLALPALRVLSVSGTPALDLPDVVCYQFNHACCATSAASSKVCQLCNFWFLHL